ncbi:MAG: hypothetical protein PHV18_09055 [Lachnospiraceae bacterium]|nr:hypothetical protein [Lachnospiraceae bacterium]
MRQKKRIAFVLTIACILLCSFPAMAGEWKQNGEEQWQYIQDDGTKATGWLELDGDRYYLDADGIRQSNRWIKDKSRGAWYYLDEDGVMATDTWVDNYYVDENGRYEKKR